MRRAADLDHAPPVVTDRLAPLRVWKQALRRVARVFLLLAVMLSATLGGARYVWCVPMHRAMVHACCPPSGAHHDAPTAVDDPSCCEGRQFTAMTATPLPELPLHALVASPVVTALAFALVCLALAGAARPRPVAVRAFARAGPRRRIYLTHCSLRN